MEGSPQTGDRGARSSTRRGATGAVFSVPGPEAHGGVLPGQPQQGGLAQRPDPAVGVAGPDVIWIFC